MAALLAGFVVDGHKACGSSYACSSYLAAARQQACSAGPGCGGIAKQNLAGVLAGVLALLLAACRGRLLRGRQVKRKSVEGRRHAAGSVQLHSARRRQGAQTCQTAYPPIHTPQISGRPCPRRLTR